MNSGSNELEHRMLDRVIYACQRAIAQAQCIDRLGSTYSPARQSRLQSPRLQRMQISIWYRYPPGSQEAKLYVSFVGIAVNCGMLHLTCKKSGTKPPSCTLAFVSVINSAMGLWDADIYSLTDAAYYDGPCSELTGLAMQFTCLAVMR